MHRDVGREIAALPRLAMPELRAKYAELFGDETNANNKAWLVKRIAWRLQVLAEGDLSERARRRAVELAREADLRLTPPRAKAACAAAVEGTPITAPPLKDERLPMPGTVLTRQYKGTRVQVTILPHGFAYAGEVYPSLSAVAKAVSGSHCNGFLFFRLGKRGAP